MREPRSMIGSSLKHTSSLALYGGRFGGDAGGAVGRIKHIVGKRKEEAKS